MTECSFERLLQLLDKRLSTDAQLKLFDHLDKCEICRETIYHIARDRDEAMQILLPQGRRKSPRASRMGQPTATAVSALSRARRASARHDATGTLG